MIWRSDGSRRWRLALLLLLWPLLCVGGLAASDRWLRGAYLDFTANHLYTLTPGTRQILSSLQQPIELKLYFSKHAAADLPQLRSYQQRVAEMLREFASRSHGMLRLKLIDPLPYSDDAVSAESDGLTPLNGGSNGEQLFLGLVGQMLHPTQSATQLQTIPLLDPSREGFLEYDIAKLLYELNTTSRPRIEFVSGLPMAGNPGRGESPWVLLEQLRQLFNVTWIDQAAFRQVAKDVKAVFLIHPTELSTAAQYALDQYVLRGGHLVVFVDPDAEMSDKPAAGSPLPASSDLPRLLHTWGVRYDPHEVVLDRALALPIELSDQSRSAHPAMLGLGTAELNHHDMITAGLQRVNLSSAGHFDLTAHTQSRLIPLLQSSADAELISAQRVSAAENDPALLLDGYQPDGMHYVLAARLRGVLNSAFPEYAQRPGHLARSQGPVEVLLVADTDLLSDRLWLRYEQNSLGQPELSVLADNGDFMTDMADALTSSSVLLSVHGRATSQRPFTRVQALQNAADQKSLIKQRELQRELAVTRHRLLKLQAAKEGDPAGAHAEQKSEVEQFLHRQLQINQELREVKHSLNAEIDALGQKLKLINIGLMPLLVALLGLIYGSWRRARNRRSRPSTAPTATPPPKRTGT